MDTLWSSLQTWQAVSSLAPIATAGIALLAAGVAYCALSVQRDLTRKRAAIDFFLKTETDETIANAYKATDDIRVKYTESGSIGEIIKNYDDLITVTHFLNIFELLAVGIHTKIFDEDICFDYWSSNLITRHREWKLLIEPTEKKYGAPSYTNLVQLATHWQARIEHETPKKRA
jgi:hypothetical protein